MRRSAAALLVLFTACGRRPTPRTTPDSPPTPSDAAAFPDDPVNQIGAVYDTLLDNMLSSFFEEHAEFEKQHRPALAQFVRTTLERGRFVQAFAEPFREIFDRAQTDAKFRTNERFATALSVAREEATSTGKAMMARRFDVYRRKIMIPDALTTSLFPTANGAEQEELVAGVTGQITATAFRADRIAGAAIPFWDSDDPIYSFRTPTCCWKEAAGRTGFFIVNRGKIFAVVDVLRNAPADASAVSTASRAAPSPAMTWATDVVLKTFPVGWYAATYAGDSPPSEMPLLLRDDGWVRLDGHRPTRQAVVFHRAVGRWEAQTWRRTDMDLAMGDWGATGTTRYTMLRTADGSLKLDATEERVADAAPSPTTAVVLRPLAPEKQARAENVLRDVENPENCAKRCACAAKLKKPVDCRPPRKFTGDPLDFEPRKAGCDAWDRPCRKYGPGRFPGNEWLEVAMRVSCWEWLDEQRQRHAHDTKEPLPAECN